VASRRKARNLIEVGGISQMASSLRRLGDEDLSKEMKAASKAAAEKIVPYAKQRVPVRTGALRDSIRAGATRRYGQIMAGTGVKTRPYAYFVHRGHGYAGSKGRYTGKRYISKAVPEAWPQIIDEYVKSMNRIAKAFQKKHGIDRVYGGFRK
jgi:hypothetical protein